MAASWRPLGALGELLGSLGGLLGSFWRPLEPLGELLGSLGSLLAASWGSLGTSLLAWKRKSGPGSSGSMIFEAPRRPPWRENGPGSSGEAARGAHRLEERAAGPHRDPSPPPKAFS